MLNNEYAKPTILQRSYSWFSNIPFANPTERSIAILVQVLLAGFSLITILGVILWVIIARNLNDSMRPTMIGLAIAAVMCAAVWIVRRGRLDQAVLLATTGLLLALWFNFNGVGMHYGAGLLIAFVLPITLAGFMSDRRGLVLTITLTIALVTLTVLLETWWPGLAAYAAPKGLPAGAVLIAFALVAGLLGYFIDQGVSVLRKALEESLAREQELAAMHASLEARTVELSRAKEALEAELRVRRQAEAALNHERDLLHTLMDNLPDLIYFKDTSSRFIRINQAEARLLGISDPDAAVGKSNFDFQPHELAQAIYQEEQQIVATGAPLLDQVVLNPAPDGRVRWLSVTKVPIKDRDGRVIGIVGLSRDITARHEIERMKNEFIATVSHELRTPLTSIRGSLGLVAGGVTGVLPPAAQDMLEIAFKNSERLTKLVNDILDIEKVESGRMTFEFAPVDLRALVEQAIEIHRPYADEYAVTYALTSGAPGLLARADAERLMQVIANLLSNAAKFSPQGGVVAIAIARDGQMLRVAVTDHGPGIPLSFRERIFGKFAQADASDTRRKGGTGLGLSIAKALIEQMSGQIGFSSEPGAGTTFYIQLPVWAGK